MPATNMIKTIRPRRLSAGLLGRITNAAVRQMSVTAYLWKRRTGKTTRKDEPERQLEKTTRGNSKHEVFRDCIPPIL